MITKENLSQVKEYLNKLRYTYDYAKELEDDIRSISPITTKKTDYVRTGRVRAESGLLPAERRLEKMEAYEKAKYRYFVLKNEIMMQLDKLPNAQHMDLLYYRYVRFMSLDKVAKEMHREYNYTCALHGKALISFGTINGLIKSEYPQFSATL